jgi:hypothetical protein
MLIIGYIINFVYQEPCAKLPVFLQQHQCRPVFIFALSYLTFEKMSSAIDGTRIRGVLFSKDTFEKTDYLQDFPLFKVVSQLMNILYVYTLLKHFRDSAYFVSVTRV